MEPNNSSNNLPDNMDVVVIIDKDKLPENVRKLLEENLPKDVLEQQMQKVLQMLERPPPVSDKKVPGKLDNGLLDNSTPDNRDNKSDNKFEDNKLFVIQTGSVIGNIYANGIYKREEDSYVKKKT